MQVINVTQSTAVTIPIFMRNANTDQGLAGLSSELVITSKPNGSGFSTIAPTVTDRGNGWYDLAFTSGMVATLGLMPLRITAPGVPVGQAAALENDEITLNVIAGNPYISPQPANVTEWQGSSPAALDSAGNVPADVEKWLGTAPAALSTNGYVQAIVLRWLTDNTAGTPAALVNNNVPSDVVQWLGAAPAALSTNGYVQAMLMRWLTDNSSGTPNALSSGLVEATVDGEIVVTNVNVVQWLGSTPAALDGSGNVPANVEAVSVAGATAIAQAVLNAARSGYLTLGSIGEGIALAASLLQGNFYIDNVTTSSNGPTAQRLRCWTSAAGMSGVTPGGSGQGEFATFQVTTTYTGPGAIATHQVIQT
jgi:hypothetical protein